MPAHTEPPHPMLSSLQLTSCAFSVMPYFPSWRTLIYRERFFSPPLETSATWRAVEGLTSVRVQTTIHLNNFRSSHSTALE